MDVQRHLGGLLLARGQIKEAIAAWQQMVKWAPECHEEQNNLGWFLATAADPELRDPVRAVEHAKKAVALLPVSPRGSTINRVFAAGGANNTLGAALYRAGSRGRPCCRDCF